MRAIANEVYNFYVYDAPRRPKGTGTLPPSYRFEMWRPKLWRILPLCLLRARKAEHLLNLRYLSFFWLHHYLKRFWGRNDYCIALVFQGNDLAHFAVVRTRDYRFPFMCEDDLQIGPVWTDSTHRGRGLASGAVAHVQAQLSGAWRRVWWICPRENAASNAVASKAGFSLLGEGRRTVRLGLRVLGRFVVADGAPGGTRKPEFTAITETPWTRATRDQLSILCTRYHFAAQWAKGKEVLEVACGAGIGLGYLAREASRVVGGDIEEKNWRYAAETYHGRQDVLVRLFDAQDMPFEEGSFDVVVLLEAIYYLPAPASFLRAAHRVMRPDGTLLISSVHCRWPGFNPSPYSQKYYDDAELTLLLAECGFESALYAGFPEDRSGPLSRAVRLVRRAAVSLHLIPKTMKGKEWLKRFFYGRLAPIPRELTPGIAPIEPLVRVGEAGDLTKYRMIYAVARKAKHPKDLK